MSKETDADDTSFEELEIEADNLAETQAQLEAQEELENLEMKTFEIMFDDLNEEAQQRFLEFQGLEDAADGNYEIIPIATIDLEDEE